MQVDAHLNTCILSFLMIWSLQTETLLWSVTIPHSYVKLWYFIKLALPDMGIRCHAVPVFCTNMSVKVTCSLKILCNHFRILIIFALRDVNMLMQCLLKFLHLSVYLHRTLYDLLVEFSRKFVPWWDFNKNFVKFKQK